MAHLELNLALDLLIRRADAEEKVRVKGKHAECRVGGVDRRQSDLIIGAWHSKSIDVSCFCTSPFGKKRLGTYLRLPAVTGTA